MEYDKKNVTRFGLGSFEQLYLYKSSLITWVEEIEKFFVFFRP